MLYLQTFVLYSANAYIYDEHVLMSFYLFCLLFYLLIETAHNLNQQKRQFRCFPCSNRLLIHFNTWRKHTCMRKKTFISYSVCLSYHISVIDASVDICSSVLNHWNCRRFYRIHQTFIQAEQLAISQTCKNTT